MHLQQKSAHARAWRAVAGGRTSKTKKSNRHHKATHNCTQSVRQNGWRGNGSAGPGVCKYASCRSPARRLAGVGVHEVRRVGGVDAAAPVVRDGAWAGHSQGVPVRRRVRVAKEIRDRLFLAAWRVAQQRQRWKSSAARSAMSGSRVGLALSRHRRNLVGNERVNVD